MEGDLKYSLDCNFGGPSGDKSFVPVDKSVITVGQDSTCDIILPSQKVSEFHGRFESGTSNGEHFLNFLDTSRHGTIINKNHIMHGELCPLRHNDKLIFRHAFGPQRDAVIVVKDLEREPHKNGREGGGKDRAPDASPDEDGGPRPKRKAPDGGEERREDFSLKRAAVGGGAADAADAPPSV